MPFASNATIPADLPCEWCGAERRNPVHPTLLLAASYDPRARLAVALCVDCATIHRTLMLPAPHDCRTGMPDGRRGKGAR